MKAAPFSAAKNSPFPGAPARILYSDPVKRRHFVMMIGLAAVLFLVSICMGRYNLAPQEGALVFFSGLIRSLSEGWSHLTGWFGQTAVALTPDPAAASPPALSHTVIFQIRLPRVMAAILVGGGLSLAGCMLQGLFKNPLVSPDILGVASGAGFGAALGILVSGHPLLIQSSAFSFGLLAVSIAYGIGRIYRNQAILVLVLSGIMISALFSALLSLVKYVADPYDQLPTIVFWLMGSLSSVTMRDLFLVGPPILLCSLVLLVLRWRVNLMALGETEARALGVDTRRLTRIIIICTTIITASAVCISGIVGWVGLVVPHIGRLLVGPDFKKLAPASALIGASYMMLVDDISRTAFATEIPLGILTAVIGAPLFTYLLIRKKVGWS